MLAQCVTDHDVAVPSNRVAFTGTVTFRTIKADRPDEHVRAAMDEAKSEIMAIVHEIVRWDTMGVPRGVIHTALSDLLTRDYRSVFCPLRELDKAMKPVRMQIDQRFSPLTGTTLIRCGRKRLSADKEIGSYGSAVISPAEFYCRVPETVDVSALVYRISSKSDTKFFVDDLPASKQAAA